MARCFSAFLIVGLWFAGCSQAVVTSVHVAPIIASFTATPSAVALGTQTSITWTWSFANTPVPMPSCGIDNGVDAMTSGGASNLTLLATTTFTLTCTNDAGSDTKTVTVIDNCHDRARNCYYVSSEGNDDNSDGLLPSSAWASLGKVSSALADGTIAAGDIVAFRSGDTFVGTLDTHGVDGTADHPIVLTSYGMGGKPTFSSLVTLGDNWIYQGANIWRYDVSLLPTTHIRYLLLDGINQKMAQSIVRYSTAATTSSFTDADLGGAKSDYVGAEVLMRTSSFMWEIRPVVGYDATSGTVSYKPLTLWPTGTGGSVGGYFFQNSLHILEQNAVQGEWVHDGGYLYFYSSNNPNELGRLDVSAMDSLAIIRNSDYVALDNINFEYANERCVYSGNSNYMSIGNCAFDRCVFALHDGQTPSSYGTIDSNVVTNSGSGGISQYYPVNLTLTNNTIIDTGLEIGKMPYMGVEEVYWGYDAVHMNLDGGLVEYNNITNAGYMGMKLDRSKNHALVQHNYVRNACLTLVDGGAFYTYYDTDPTSSAINKITFRDNIAVFDDYGNLRYKIGYEGSPYGWLTVGFYKDGFLRAANYYDNFSVGYQETFIGGPSMYSEWRGNVGVGRYYAVGGDDRDDRTFTLVDKASAGVFWTNNLFIENTFVSNFLGVGRLAQVWADQLAANSGNSIDYNRMLQPFTTGDDLIYVFGSDEHLSIDEWKAKGAVGPHETSNLLTYPMSGLTVPTDFVWYAVNPTKDSVPVIFPGGYRYYTVDGDMVSSDTLGVYKGKVYFRTIDEGMPQATNVSYGGSAQVGETQTGSYSYAHEEGNAESGSTYRWYLSADDDVRGREPILGATGLSYTPVTGDVGKYLFFSVTPRSAPGSGQLVVGVERFSAGKLCQAI